MATASPVSQSLRWSARSPPLCDEDLDNNDLAALFDTYEDCEEEEEHSDSHLIAADLMKLSSEDWKEIRSVMLFKEGTQLKVLSAEFKERRRILVEWMFGAGRGELQLLPVTLHLAVAYLDSAVTKLGDQVVKPARLQLLAVACILTAAKMEEKEERVPLVYELNQLCQSGYTAQLIVKMESLLLSLLEWNLSLVTPRHFLELYQSAGAFEVHHDECLCSSPIPAYKIATTQRSQREYAKLFVDLCLYDHNFVNYRPSVVAAAALVAARRYLKITPLWPHRLAKATKWDYEGLSQCAEQIWRSVHSPLGKNNGEPRTD
jgi:hypothetical protein